jgi:pimeloyl-ACP methyl ester carboxylesterase
MKTFVIISLLFIAAISMPAQETAEPKPVTEKIEADAAKGFAYPFYLYTPASFDGEKSKNKTQTILVMPNNTGKISDDPAVHEENVKRKMMQVAFAFGKLETAVLMPVFPRPETDWKIYTHALDRDSMTTDKAEYRRFDLQLAAMIDAARAHLAGKNIKTDERVLIYGFSASGMFANRFAFLHPERVKAAAVGSPGGWPIAPVASYREKTLPYPIGVGDFKDISGRQFAPEAVRQVAFFVFLGDKDDNDSVTFRDGYEEQDEKLVFELFGKTPIDRWETSKKLYEDQKLNAVFKLYPDVEHKMTPEMIADITAFFEKHKSGER